MSNAKAVTVNQFYKWLKKNVNKTWYIVDIMKGGFAADRPGHAALIKYITPFIDTRTMEIYMIEFSGSFPDGKGKVHTGMPFEGNILELLESKFPKEFKE